MCDEKLPPCLWLVSTTYGKFLVRADSAEAAINRHHEDHPISAELATPEKCWSMLEAGASVK